jgi:DNA-binding IscR family transcriptional regulator
MVATRFAVAIHILVLLAAETAGPVTSARIAGSVGTNPVVIRRISGRLSRAGLIQVRRGPGGARLARPAATITLGEVWRAVRAPDLPLLPMHRPNGADPLGRRIPDLLRTPFVAAEAALAHALDATSLWDLARRLEGAAAPAQALGISQPARRSPAREPGRDR